MNIKIAFHLNNFNSWVCIFICVYLVGAGLADPDNVFLAVVILVVVVVVVVPFILDVVGVPTASRTGLGVVPVVGVDVKLVRRCGMREDGSSNKKNILIW